MEMKGKQTERRADERTNLEGGGGGGGGAFLDFTRDSRQYVDG